MVSTFAAHTRRITYLIGLIAVLVMTRSIIDAVHQWGDKSDIAVLTTVNDSTKAELAKEQIKNKELAALLDAAKKMGGKPVAGVVIHTKPETVFVNTHTVDTKWLADSVTRIASLTDTTKDGHVVTVNAVAPPNPKGLELGYKLVVPSFSPQVGFVKRPEGYFAVVSWAGKEFTTAGAFYRPEKERRLSVVAGTTVMSPMTVDPTQGLRLDGYGAVQYRFTERYTVQARVGWLQLPYAGVNVQMKVF